MEKQWLNLDSADQTSHTNQLMVCGIKDRNNLKPSFRRGKITLVSKVCKKVKVPFISSNLNSKYLNEGDFKPEERSVGEDQLKFNFYIYSEEINLR